MYICTYMRYKELKQTVIPRAFFFAPDYIQLDD